jgi:hypothetical protein
VIIDRDVGCLRWVASLFGFVVAQAGPGDGEIEDLDDLGAETAGELRSPPTALMPATRPCLCAVVPRGR